MRNPSFALIAQFKKDHPKLTDSERRELEQLEDFAKAVEAIVTELQVVHAPEQPVTNPRAIAIAKANRARKAGTK